MVATLMVNLVIYSISDCETKGAHLISQSVSSKHFFNQYTFLLFRNIEYTSSRSSKYVEKNDLVPTVFLPLSYLILFSNFKPLLCVIFTSCSGVVQGIHR